MRDHLDPSSPQPAEPLRATVCAWLEADGWSVSPHFGGPVRGEEEFRWVAVAERDDAPLVVAEPAAGSRRLVLSHHFTLQPAERERLEALTAEERGELVWELFRHLNLLLVDYQADRTVPREVLLTLTLPADGLTRESFLRRLLRLAAALRLVSLIFHRALGTLLQGPAAPVTH